MLASAEELTGTSIKLSFSFTAAATGVCFVWLEFANPGPHGPAEVGVGFAIVFTRAGHTTTGTMFIYGAGEAILQHDATTHTVLHINVSDTVVSGFRFATAHLAGSFTP